MAGALVRPLRGFIVDIDDEDFGLLAFGRKYLDGLLWLFRSCTLPSSMV
jgi:hypothetical protein